MPPGPFQLTQTARPPSSPTTPIPRAGAPPSQMWQQLDCASTTRPRPTPRPIASRPLPLGRNHHRGGLQRGGTAFRRVGEGSTSMFFFNVQLGDAPYLKSLADHYAISDNYHQAVHGGGGANHMMLGSGDATSSATGGRSRVPPNDPVDPATPGTPLPDLLGAFRNRKPEPATGYNNFYIQDGYGGGSGNPAATPPNANYGGGSYANCADTGQPGVRPSGTYRCALKPRSIPVRARPLLSDEQLQSGLFRRRLKRLRGHQYRQLRIHDSAVKHAHHRRRPLTTISWAYFGDSSIATSRTIRSSPEDEYCNICNWAQ